MGKGAMVVEQRAVDADPVSAFKRHGGGDHRMPRKRVPRTVLAHHHTACTLTLVRVLRRVCVCACVPRAALPSLTCLSGAMCLLRSTCKRHGPPEGGEAEAEAECERSAGSVRKTA